MNEWNRPVSEYRGEFKWNYKEGFSREGRREKEVDRLSADLKQLRLAKKREKEQKGPTAAGNESTLGVGRALNPPVIVDTDGDEYEVCETAKEALERLIKSDHRLASKYHDHIKKLDDRLIPHGTSYQNSFMRSANLFPSVRAYEMAAEEFEKNQGYFESPAKNSKFGHQISPEWESKLASYGSVPESHLDGTQGHSSHLHIKLQQDESDQQGKTGLEDAELMRQKWVDTAHQELSRSFQLNHQNIEESRE